MNRVGKWVESLFEEHKLVRRSTVLWAVLLITFVVVVSFSQIELITTPVAVAIGSVVGILSVVINMYLKLRAMEDDDVS